MDGFQVVSKEIIDEYRWGVIYEIILQDGAGNFWIFDYQEQVGDHYHNSLEDYEKVGLNQVKRVEKVTYSYVRI